MYVGGAKEKRGKSSHLHLQKGVPRAPRLLAHFNFTLNWTSKRCLISAYQRQPAALRYAHLSRFVCLPLQHQAWQSSYHSSPPRSRSRKELVSEKWWVICCWYWRGESWGSGDSSSESASVKRDASVCHSHVHHKHSLHTHAHTCTVFPLFCCSFYHSVCLSVTLSIHPSFCHLSFHLSILLTSFILSIHTSIFISFYPSTHP